MSSSTARRRPRARAPGVRSFTCEHPTPIPDTSRTFRCNTCPGCKALSQYRLTARLKGAVGTYVRASGPPETLPAIRASGSLPGVHLAGAPTDPDSLWRWVMSEDYPRNGFNPWFVTVTWHPDRLAALGLPNGGRCPPVPPAEVPPASAPAVSREAYNVVARPYYAFMSRLEVVRKQLLRSWRDALCRDPVIRGPARFRSVGSARSRVLRPEGWCDPYPPDHRHRVPKARGQRRLVLYAGQFEIGPDSGLLHLHAIVLNPVGLSPAVVFSLHEPPGADGTPSQCHVRAQPIRRLSGAVAYVVGYIADPTKKIPVGRRFSSLRLPIVDRYEIERRNDRRFFGAEVPT